MKTYKNIIKLLLAFSALIIMLIKPSNLTVLDYQLWLIFICMAAASILDFMEYYRDFGYASTLTLTLIALVFLFAGRFGISLITSLATCYPGPLIGFIILTPDNLYLHAYFCGILMAGALRGHHNPPHIRETDILRQINSICPHHITV